MLNLSVYSFIVNIKKELMDLIANKIFLIQEYCEKGPHNL